MVLVFGGTTEGRKVANVLEGIGVEYIYSTKTQIDFKKSLFCTYRYGAFTKDQLVDFSKQNNIKIIIHASHPFAALLHETIDEAAKTLSIPVVRFEREYLVRVENNLVRYVSGYAEAIEYLVKNKIIQLLALTGVQSIEKMKPYWERHKAIFRILPRESSLNIAKESGFPVEWLLMEMPSENIEEEVRVIKENKIDGILTKESGESGFLSTKINAALSTKKPIVIIEKPPLPDNFICVYSENELTVKIKDLLNELAANT